jgi:hypothetical protein
MPVARVQHLTAILIQPHNAFATRTPNFIGLTQTDLIDIITLSR